MAGCGDWSLEGQELRFVFGEYSIIFDAHFCFPGSVIADQANQVFGVYLLGFKWFSFFLAFFCDCCLK